MHCNLLYNLYDPVKLAILLCSTFLIVSLFFFVRLKGHLSWIYQSLKYLIDKYSYHCAIIMRKQHIVLYVFLQTLTFVIKYCRVDP